MSIARGFLEEVRTRISLAELIGRRVRLTRRGREYVGLCPFHNEKTPSFCVVEDKGFFRAREIADAEVRREYRRVLTDRYYEATYRRRALPRHACAAPLPLPTPRPSAPTAEDLDCSDALEAFATDFTEEAWNAFLEARAIADRARENDQHG